MCTGFFAIGDLIAGPMLAHKAEEEGHCGCRDSCRKESSGRLCGHPQRHLYLARSRQRWTDGGTSQRNRQTLQRGPLPVSGQRPSALPGRGRRLGQSHRRQENRSPSGHSHHWAARSELIAEATLAMSFMGSCRRHRPPAMPTRRSLKLSGKPRLRRLGLRCRFEGFGLQMRRAARSKPAGSSCVSIRKKYCENSVQ